MGLARAEKDYALFDIGYYIYIYIYRPKAYKLIRHVTWWANIMSLKGTQEVC
jgi:hypothetical protein